MLFALHSRLPLALRLERRRYTGRSAPALSRALALGGHADAPCALLEEYPARERVRQRAVAEVFAHEPGPRRRLVRAFHPSRRGRRRARRGIRPGREQAARAGRPLWKRARYRPGCASRPCSSRRASPRAGSRRSRPWPRGWRTPMAGFSSAQQRPLTAATPMRTPVKEPGPRATATASSSDLIRARGGEQLLRHGQERGAVRQSGALEILPHELPVAHERRARGLCGGLYNPVSAFKSRLPLSLSAAPWARASRSGPSSPRP